jgi:hypothetical protein
MRSRRKLVRWRWQAVAGSAGGIDTVIGDLLEAGSVTDSFVVQRAQRYRAEFLAEAGGDTEALTLLRDLRDRQAMQVVARRTGLVLDALGQAERRAETVKSLNLHTKPPA